MQYSVPLTVRHFDCMLRDFQVRVDYRTTLTIIDRTRDDSEQCTSFGRKRKAQRKFALGSGVLQCHVRDNLQ
jgi:hypothetical protein